GAPGAAHEEARRPLQVARQVARAHGAGGSLLSRDDGEGQADQRAGEADPGSGFPEADRRAAQRARKARQESGRAHSRADADEPERTRAEPRSHSQAPPEDADRGASRSGGEGVAAAPGAA